MLSMRMDLDLTNTEDGFMLKDQLNDHFLKNNDERGKSIENESKVLEESKLMDTNEEFSRSTGISVDAANDRPPLPARRSNSAGSLSPSEKADEQEQHLTKESYLRNEYEGSNLGHSGKMPMPMVEDYECHTENQELNAAGELPCDNVDDTSTLGMEAGDYDPFLSESFHEHRNLTLSHGQNGQFDTISVDCSFVIANDNNKQDCGSIVDETKLKGDYHMIGVVPSQDLVVTESCDINSPEEETPVSGDLHDKSPETELAREDQRLPEVEEGKSSSPPNKLSFPEMERERPIMQSPARCLERAPLVSPERHTSGTSKRSPDKTSSSRPDQLPIEKSDKNPAHSRKRTPSPERHISAKKRASSHERLSPSVRHKYSGRTAPENAHRDHSPKKRLSSPPPRRRRRVSPLKRGKSVSRSPIRRKDSSTIQKDHKSRYRSRSPNASTEVEEGKSASPLRELSFPDMERTRSIMQSPARCLDRAPSVSPVRQTSDTLKRSPGKKSSSRPDELPIEKGDKKPVHSRKRTPTPERHISGKKRASSHEWLSPARHKSSGRAAPENAHRDHSPKKRLPSPPPPPPPRRRVSPLKRGKSVSRSPIHRKDSSTNRKDHKGRSRSRSPNARDHYGGSSRRRHSPRRRSPPSSTRSRHRSPRRPWSPPPNRNTGVGKPGRNLFVAGFSYTTTERDLENKFSRFGQVRGVRIVRDKRSGESRGFGFVSMEKDEDADAAIRAVDRTEWNGRIVLVEKSKTPAR